MNKKRLNLNVLAVALSFLLVTVCAHAQEGRGKGKENRGKWKKHSEEMMKELNLTPEQKEQLKTHKEKHRSDMKDLREKIEEKRKSIHQELSKPDFNESEVRNMHNELKMLNNQMEDNRLDGILAIREILTPEQFKQFREHRKGMFKNKRDHWKKNKEAKEEKE